MRSNTVLFALASAVLTSSPFAQMASNSGSMQTFDPAYVVQPPTAAGGCIVGFVGDTTIAGGWTAFETASDLNMDVLASGAMEFDQLTAIPWVNGEPLSLAPAHEKRIVGSSWGTWSHGYTGEVFWAQGFTSSLLTLPPEAAGFDCYLEPGPFQVYTYSITGTASDSSTSTINVTADGFGGASHFGFYTTGNCCLISISISGPATYSIGELRLGVCGVGTNYCTVNPNSTTFPAHIWAGGSASIGMNDFTLNARQLPSSQYYIFFHSPNQQDTPFGNGRLCVAAPITRLMPPLQSTAGGLAVRAVDVSGFTPGTRNFQCWFRDPPAGGSAFNTSEGLSVTFVP